MANIQNKIIHRFIRNFADYDVNGTYYGQIIPTDTQAFAIYPEDSDTPGVYYVIGDGIHTYLEIKRGLGEEASTNEFPVFTKSTLDDISHKQDALIAGSNITIEGNVISADGTASLKFENVVVDPSMFTNDTRFESFNHKADISLSGVTEDMFPIVIFSSDDVLSENYYFLVESYNGGVTIWCKDVPEKMLVIPTITCQ